MFLGTNTFNQEMTKSLISSANELKTVLYSSYGPKATGQTIYKIGNSSPISCTKDGYKFASTYYYPNTPAGLYVRDLALTISKTVNASVGDGTTASLILSAELIQRVLSSDIAPYELLSLAKLYSKDFKTSLESIAKKSTSEKTIRDLATNACRSKVLGKLVAEAITLLKRKGGEIKLLDSRGTKEEVTSFNGTPLEGRCHLSVEMDAQVLTNSEDRVSNWIDILNPKILLTTSFVQSDISLLFRHIKEYDLTRRKQENIDSSVLNAYLVGIEAVTDISISNLAQYLRATNTFGSNIKIIPFSYGSPIQNADNQLLLESTKVRLGVSDDKLIVGTSNGATSNRSIKYLEFNPHDRYNFLSNKMNSAVSLGVMEHQLFLHEPTIDENIYKTFEQKLQTEYNTIIDRLEKSGNIIGQSSDKSLRGLQDIIDSFSLNKIYIKYDSSTRIESEYIQDLIEDAIETCKSLIRNGDGVISGGGLGLYQVAKRTERLNPKYSFFTDWLSTLLKFQLSKTNLDFETVINSDTGYNYNTGERDPSVIDNAGTFRVIVQSCIGNLPAIMCGSITVIDSSPRNDTN